MLVFVSLVKSYLYCNTSASGQSMEEGRTFSLLRCEQIRIRATTTIHCLTRVFDTEGDHDELVPERGETAFLLLQVFWLK